ncbi:MAG: glycosyltransferase family 39 protein [Endomicrobiales bacterium]|nr:glycosyltransferase family 39 protein [Endomicrobiales bacterium]
MEPLPLGKLFTKKNSIIFVGLMTLWRIFLAATMQLHPDEAYYWLWARNPALSYFDHPPMVGYFIWITTLFSNSELWVRLSGILISVALSILIWHLSKQLFNSEAVSSLSVVLLNIIPLTMTGSIIITPDIPMFLFWGLCIYLAWQIVRTGKVYLWYLLGVAFGCALLSKYTAILLVPCLFLFFALTDERKWLKTIHPYLSLLTSFIVFSPVILWNRQNSWISFKFQFGHGLGSGETHYIANFFEFIGGQLLVASPLLWVAGMAVVGAWVFSRNKEKLFLALTSLPIIAFFWITSIKKAGEANWTAPAYFTFMIALGAYFFNAKNRKWLLITSLSFAVFMSGLITLHARFNILPLRKMNEEWAKTDATKWLYGWRELSNELKKYPDAKFVLTPSHQLSAALAYYCRGDLYVNVDKKVTRRSQFNLWDFPEELYGKDGLYVYFQNNVEGPYAEYFESINSVEPFTVYRDGFPIHKFKIAAGRKYLHSK